MQDSDCNPVSSPLAPFYAGTSPLNPRLVDSLATLMSTGNPNLENIAYNHPNNHPVRSFGSEQQIPKQQVLSQSSSSSSRLPLANISNRMPSQNGSGNPEKGVSGSLSGSGSVRLVRGDASSARPSNSVTSSPKGQAAPAKRTPLSRLNQRSENVFKPAAPSKKIKLRESWSR